MDFFDKMLDDNRINGFLEYRSNRKIPDFRVESMQEYLSSPRYREDVLRIKNGDYYFSIPEKKLIPKSYTDRKRTVYHFEEDEMTLLRVMSYILHDYEYIFVKELYSFKKGISAKNFLRFYQRNPSLHNMYVAKTDIKSYGNSIDADILIQKLEAALGNEEPELLSFFIWLLNRKQFTLNGQLTTGDTSALAGIPIHNFFTNLYLSDTDHILTDRCAAYARYSDDILMITPTYDEAKENMDFLMKEFERLHLTPHGGDKTTILRPGETFEYLGISMTGNQADIAPSSIKKLKRKMRIRAKRIQRDKKGRYNSPEEKAKHLLLLNHRTFYGKPGSRDLSWSQWAFPVITRTDSLKALDLYNQRCLRYVLTGKWSDAQYRVKYEELKKLGYKSLVREYYSSEGADVY